MPRIQAPTVAEHRAAQHRALLDAARQILAETGRPPTLARVAARAGLARPSLYQYFRSAEDLLNAVVQDVFPRWSARVTAAMDAATTPADRVLAYVLTNFELITEGEHALATVLARGRTRRHRRRTEPRHAPATPGTTRRDTTPPRHPHRARDSRNDQRHRVHRIPPDRIRHRPRNRLGIRPSPARAIRTHLGQHNALSRIGLEAWVAVSSRSSRSPRTARWRKRCPCRAPPGRSGRP